MKVLMLEELKKKKRLWDLGNPLQPQALLVWYM
jgi:hypothetical protein